MDVWGYLGLFHFFPHIATKGETSNDAIFFLGRKITYDEYTRRSAELYRNPAPSWKEHYCSETGAGASSFHGDAAKA